MTPSVVRGIGLVQVLSLFALVIVFVRPQAGWSRRARVPVAIIAFLSSALHLFLTIS